MSESIVKCTIDGCDWSTSGVAEFKAEDVPKAMRLGELMGATSTFFINRYLVEELQRIEDQIAEHLESHSMLEALTTIARLNAQVYNQQAQINHFRDTPCPRNCCNR